MQILLDGGCHDGEALTLSEIGKSFDYEYAKSLARVYLLSWESWSINYVCLRSCGHLCEAFMLHKEEYAKTCCLCSAINLAGDMVDSCAICEHRAEVAEGEG